MNNDTKQETCTMLRPKHGLIEAIQHSINTQGLELHKAF